MPEPDSHTLRLLRDIRRQGEENNKGLTGLRGEFQVLRDEFHVLRSEVTQGFEHLGERIEHLTRLVTGESVLGRYAAANVDERLDALERRLAALEQRS